jgi:hypothetical protein
MASLTNTFFFLICLKQYNAQAVKRCDHVRVYVHVCVRVNVYERAHESVLCLRECVHAHGHAYDRVSANILPLVNGTSNLS